MNKNNKIPNVPNLEKIETNPDKNWLGENLKDIPPSQEGEKTSVPSSENIGEASEQKEDKTVKLKEIANKDREEYDKARKELGLPPSEENLAAEEELKKVKPEQDATEQKEEEMSQREKEKRIQEEKEKIIQEKIDELFRQFESFSAIDFKKIAKNGMETSPLGSIDNKTAKSLIKAFQEGAKLLPQILEILPDILKKLDEDLTKEAEERVEKKLEEEKQNKDKEKKDTSTEKNENNAMKSNEAPIEEKDPINNINLDVPKKDVW